MTGGSLLFDIVKVAGRTEASLKALGDDAADFTASESGYTRRATR